MRITILLFCCVHHVVLTFSLRGQTINAVSIRHQRPYKAVTASDDGNIAFYQGAIVVSIMSRWFFKLVFPRGALQIRQGGGERPIAPQEHD